MALEAIITGAAANSISSAISPLIRQIDDVIRLDENRRLLEAELNRMKNLLRDISDQFQDRQQTPPESLKNSVLRMEDAVGKARELIDQTIRPQQRIKFFLRKPKLSSEIRKWKENFDELFQQLATDFSVFCSAQQIASTATQQADIQIASAAPHHANILIQDLPDTGVVGLDIKSTQIKLERWVTEAPEVQIIGVYGMGGVGKTTLLKVVHNIYKVSKVFNHVIWVTVAQFPVLELQGCIADTINLDIPPKEHLQIHSYNHDMRKMMLAKYMKQKKFFLILDDMWSPINLKELGVEFGQKGSKVVFSTRNRDLIRAMKADESVQIQPLSTGEGLELFCKVAFKDGHIPQHLEQIAKEVAGECQGLPLAITVIASTMIVSMDINDWKLALDQMKTVDLNFPITHPRVDPDLYQRLRLSYARLPDANLKRCFLYCTMFPEDTNIPVDILVRMCIAGGLIRARSADHLLDTGRSYVKLLIDRSLFQPGPESLCITVHDVIRDMAVFIGEKEENCSFVAGYSGHFYEIPRDCRTVVFNNNTTFLRSFELGCPNLVTLILRANRGLKQIPEAFLFNLSSLKVLDLSQTQLKSLPVSLWQLTQLEFLNLSDTKIAELPGGIVHLSQLRFLYLAFCEKLKSLTPEIGKLKNLKYLDLSMCDGLVVIPDEILTLSDCEIVPSSWKFHMNFN